MNKFACFFIPNQSNRRLVTLILPLTKHMNIILLYLHTRICLKYRCLPIWNISSMDILSLSLSLSNTLTITFSLIWRRAILDIRLRPPCFFLWSISTSPTRWDEIVWNVLIVKRTNFLILIFQLPSMRWWSIWLFKLQVSVFN